MALISRRMRRLRDSGVSFGLPRCLGIGWCDLKAGDEVVAQGEAVGEVGGAAREVPGQLGGHHNAVALGLGALHLDRVLERRRGALPPLAYGGATSASLAFVLDL